MSEDIYFEADDTEEGVYEATLKSIERKTSKVDGGAFLAWSFESAEGKRLSGTSSVSGHAKSKGMKWARAILGRDLAPTDPLSTLYGKPCLVAVTINDNGYPKVDDVHPRAATRKVPAAPAPAASPPPAAGAPEPTDWAEVAEADIPF